MSRQDPNLPDGVSAAMIDAYYGVTPYDDAVDDELATYDEAVDAINVAQQRVASAFSWLETELTRIKGGAKTRALADRFDDTLKALRFTENDAIDGCATAITDELGKRDHLSDDIREEIVEAILLARFIKASTVISESVQALEILADKADK